MAKTISVTQFRNKCGSLLDEVAGKGQELIVTKNGKPVAKVVPVEANQRRSLIGSILREGDIVSPIAAKRTADS